MHLKGPVLGAAPYTGKLVQLYHTTKAHPQLPRCRLPPMSPCRSLQRQSASDLSGSGRAVSTTGGRVPARTAVELLSAIIKSGKHNAATVADPLFVSITYRSPRAINAAEVQPVSTGCRSHNAATVADPLSVSIKDRSPLAESAVAGRSVVTARGRLNVRNATVACVTSRGATCTARDLQVLAVSSGTCAASMLETARPKPR